jgi:hypothetical protein
MARSRVSPSLAAAGSLLFVWCGGDAFTEAPRTPDAGVVPDAGEDAFTCPPLASRSFVANRVKMPASTSDFAVQGILAPDVHLFDAAGNFAPSPTGTKDSYSVGFEFTVVPASVTAPIP